MFFRKKKKVVRRKKTRGKYAWAEAPDVLSTLKMLVEKLELSHIQIENIKVYRSVNSQARARARIWSLPSIWRDALKIPPQYIIEVLEQHFDHLTSEDKVRVLIHELMHIPKGFSGGLVPHHGRYHKIDHHTVEQLYAKYLENNDL